MKGNSSFFYGWVIVVAAFVWISIAWGVRFSFSVFYPAILDEFDWSRASTASIYSINIVIYGLSAPLTGILVDKFGPRRVLALGAVLLLLGTVGASRSRELWQFYLTFGVVTGAGTSLLGFTSVNTMLSNWFVRRRGTVLGIVSAGTGVSYLYGTLSAYLISIMGWSRSYLVLAAIVAVILFPLVLLIPRPRPEEMGLLPDGAAQKEEELPSKKERAVLDTKWAATEWTLLKALKTYRFWALFLIFLFNTGFAIMLTMGHQVKFLEDVGYSTMFGGVIYGVFGITFTAGNLCGFIADRIGREMTFTIGNATAILGVFLLLLTGDTSQPWLPFLYIIAFGFGTGLTFPAHWAAIADLFQGKNFGSIMGSTLVGFALGGALGPWVGGRIYDAAGSYTSAFILVIAAMGLSLLFIWVASPRKVRPVEGRKRLALE